MEYVIYIPLGLSFLVATVAFIYLIIKKRRKEAAIEREVREEEILKTIKEVKELKKRIEKRGENLTFCHT